jgi:tRNA-Thr(GGU) m(6)t(6)A37 methyltransferase TsaA
MRSERKMKHTWYDFTLAAPELASFGETRLKNGPAYLATVRSTGLPRVHPVTPIIAEGHLFLFMEPTSPKGHDLQRGSGYALHCSVSSNDGGEGEFYVTGHATLTHDPAFRDLATTYGYPPKDAYILFELSVESAFSTVYPGTGQPIRTKWHTPRDQYGNELSGGSTMSAKAMLLRQIGVIRSSLTDLQTAPKQGDEGAPDAWLDIDSSVADALQGILVGDEVIVITWLHKADRDILKVHPRGDERNPLTGVFATRSPHRPNPLGLHQVTVLEISHNRMKIAPIEAIDGTPVIDIKPVLPTVPR